MLLDDRTLFELTRAIKLHMRPNGSVTDFLIPISAHIQRPRKIVFIDARNGNVVTMNTVRA